MLCLESVTASELTRPTPFQNPCGRLPLAVIGSCSNTLEQRGHRSSLRLLYPVSKCRIIHPFIERAPTDTRRRRGQRHRQAIGKQSEQLIFLSGRLHLFFQVVRISDIIPRLYYMRCQATPRFTYSSIAAINRRWSIDERASSSHPGTGLPSSSQQPPADRRQYAPTRSSSSINPATSLPCSDRLIMSPPLPPV